MRDASPVPRCSGLRQRRRHPNVPESRNVALQQGLAIVSAVGSEAMVRPCAPLL